MRFWVETSGEAPALARAEIQASAEALGGREIAPADPAVTGIVQIELPSEAAAIEIVARISLGHRCLKPIEADSIMEWLARQGSEGRSAAFRRLGHGSSGETDRSIHEAAAAYQSRGGRIALEHPERRFWIATTGKGVERLAEELGAVDRRRFASRRISRLPFSRPVGLDPRLARAAANLARVRPGDRVVDPFLGTGALLAEAGSLGAETYGIDLDPEMIRGSLRNMAYLGVPPRELLVGDAAKVAFGDPGVRFHALLTDAPYGRSSGTGGEEVESLLARVLPIWAERVLPGGRAVVVSRGGPDPLAPPWRCVREIRVRQHRSLTRSFKVYERAVV